MTVKQLRLRDVGVLQYFLSNDVALIWGIVFVAWGLILLAAIAGQDHLFSHAALSDRHSLPLLMRLFVFLAAWQVMTAAMMLPSTLPLVRLFIKASQEQSQPRLILLAFLGAYATVWTGFALCAFIADLVWHWLLPEWDWLHHHRPWRSGLTLLLVGGFQFSSFKEQCLQVCRHPFSFLTHHYQRGLKAAWNLGVHHGLYCLGCCWALMLVMFALGVNHLTWTILLTGVMTLERTSKYGRAIVPFVGIVLLAGGVLVLLQPNTSFWQGF